MNLQAEALHKREGAVAPASAQPPIANNTSAKHIKRPLKWKRVLAGFADGNSYNRFEAEWKLSDHCLHSTVSELQDRGVTILRHDEVVPGYQGIPTHVSRYWLAPASLPRALELLNGHRQAVSGG